MLIKWAIKDVRVHTLIFLYFFLLLLSNGQYDEALLLEMLLCITKIENASQMRTHNAHILHVMTRAFYKMEEGSKKNKYQTNLKLYNNRFLHKQKKSKKRSILSAKCAFSFIMIYFSPYEPSSRFPAYCYFWVVLNMTFHNGNKNKTKAEPLSDSTSHRRQGYGQWKLPKEILLHFRFRFPVSL